MRTRRCALAWRSLAATGAGGGGGIAAARHAAECARSGRAALPTQRAALGVALKSLGASLHLAEADAAAALGRHKDATARLEKLLPLAAARRRLVRVCIAAGRLDEAATQLAAAAAEKEGGATAPWVRHAHFWARSCCGSNEMQPRGLSRIVLSPLCGALRSPEATVACCRLAGELGPWVGGVPAG